MDSIDIIDCRTTNLVRLQIPDTVGVSEKFGENQQQPNYRTNQAKNEIQLIQQATSNDNNQKQATTSNNQITTVVPVPCIFSFILKYHSSDLISLSFYKYIDIYRTEA